MDTGTQIRDFLDLQFVAGSDYIRKSYSARARPSTREKEEEKKMYRRKSHAQKTGGWTRKTALFPPVINLMYVREAKSKKNKRW